MCSPCCLLYRYCADRTAKPGSTSLIYPAKQNKSLAISERREAWSGENRHKKQRKMRFAPPQSTNRAVMPSNIGAGEQLEEYYDEDGVGWKKMRPHEGFDETDYRPYYDKAPPAHLIRGSFRAASHSGMIDDPVREATFFR